MKKKLLIFIPALLILAVGALYAVANYQVKAVVDTRIAELIENGDYIALEYNSVAIEFNGDIVMNDFHVTDINNNEYILEDIRITDYDYFSRVPGHLNLSTKGLRFPSDLPAFANSQGNLLNNYLASIMVEDSLALELTYRYEYLPEDESRLQNIFRVSLPGSFNLTSQWLMKNVSLVALDQNPVVDTTNSPTVSSMIQNADIPNASLAFQDLGMVNAMLNIQGDASGMSSEQYRQQLLGQMQTAALFVPQQLQSLVQDFLGSFAEFLEGEKTFQLSITPEYGGNIQQLQGEVMGAFYIGNFSRITELLNLNIETTQSN